MPRPKHEVEIVPGIKAYGAVKIATLRALRDYGPMPRIMLERITGCSKQTMGQVVSSLHKESPRYGKRIRIVGWERQPMGSRKQYPRAIYALGTGTDAPCPWQGESRYEQMRAAQLRFRARRAQQDQIRECSLIGSAIRARLPIEQAFFGMAA